ncbi:MAG: phage protease [Rhodospirillaceae bacterium]
MKTARAHIVVALNGELPLDAPPEWIELIPDGALVHGRDGREWVNDRPDDVVAHFAALGRSLVLDWEHASEIKSPKGERAPAAGHIEAIERRGGSAIWGRINWTPQGGEDVRTGAYRYLSPVILFDKLSARIVGLCSAGLVHEPNLGLKALNHETNQPQPENPMDLTKIYAVLGLVDGANEDQILAAVNKLKTDLGVAANKAATPDLEKFVPRADYDQAVERAANAEKTLAAERETALTGEIDTAVQQALADGKIAPASEAYYRAQCKKEGGLAEFRKFLDAAPKIVGGAPAAAGGVPGTQAAALTDEEKAVCRQMDLDEEAYRKSKGGN